MVIGCSDFFLNYTYKNCWLKLAGEQPTGIKMVAAIGGDLS